MSGHHCSVKTVAQYSKSAEHTAFGTRRCNLAIPKSLSMQPVHRKCPFTKETKQNSIGAGFGIHSLDHENSLPWWRHAPMFSATEVAQVMLSVAGDAERRHLSRLPNLIGQPGCSETVVAKATCLQAAVNARTEEILTRAKAQNSHRSHGCC